MFKYAENSMIKNSYHKSVLMFKINFVNIKPKSYIMQILVQLILINFCNLSQKTQQIKKLSF